MQIRTITNCGLGVSELGLGTMTWGRDTDEYEALEQFELFLESGGNFIDTADVYSDGKAEEILGNLISETELIKREDLVISTKGGRIRNAERSLDNSFKHLSTSLDNSLSRLKSDYVDIFFIHAYDEKTSLDGVADSISSLLETGKTNYVGVSNFAAWQITYLASQIQNTRFIGTQNEYSLLQKQAELEVFPALKHLGMGFFAWSPLGRGILTGKYRISIPADSRAASPHLSQFIRPLLNEKNQLIVEALTTAAAGLGMNSLDLALLWVLKNQSTSSAITGARNAAQLRTILHASQLDLPDQIYQALNEISS